MKRIGIDAKLYNQTGVGVYLRNLLYYLESTIPEDWLIYVYLMKEDYDKVNFSHKNLIKRLANYRWHSFAEQIGFLNLINKDQLDLMHFTYFSYPILYRKKFISTIHDLTPLIYKTGQSSTKNPFIYEIKHFILRLVLKQQINNAQKILTPTETVKSQLVKYYGNHIGKKITSIYEGINYEFINNHENEQLKTEYNDRFFIYVGNFYPHKNIDNLIKAFVKVNANYRLILLGPNDYFSARIYHLINQLNQEKRIILFKNPNIEDLIYFYKNAQALIHPSLSEGFGLPIIEAMYFNLPIIASNIDVFKEILIKKYLMFNPINVKNMTDMINHFINNKTTYDYSQLIERYSFQVLTKKVINIYQSIIST